MKGFKAADFRVASRRNTMVCIRQGNMKATQGSAVAQGHASSRARAWQCKTAWGSFYQINVAYIDAHAHGKCGRWKDEGGVLTAKRRIQGIQRRVELQSNSPQVQHNFSECHKPCTQSSRNGESQDAFLSFHAQR